MKESLESKVDQITQFQAKIDGQKVDIDNIKKETNEFMYSSQQKIYKNMEQVQKNTDNFNEYVESQKLIFEKIDVERIAGNEQVKRTYLDFEKLKEVTQSKLDQM